MTNCVPKKNVDKCVRWTTEKCIKCRQGPGKSVNSFTNVLESADLIYYDIQN